MLIAPIAHEDLGDPNIIDGKAHNAELERYTALMKQVAAAAGAGFVDLFTPTKTLFDTTAAQLTINGIHLNEEGDRKLAPLIDEGLFGGARGAGRCVARAAQGGDRRQEFPLVASLPGRERLLDLRDSRRGRVRRHLPQPRGDGARAFGPRRDVRQS